MDIKQLDKMAKQRIEMPKNLNAYEQCYYIASRGLYEQYAKGEITLDQARIEKEEVIKTYKEGEWQWNYFVKLHDVKDKLVQLKQEGFDSVLEMEILDTLEELLR